MNQQGKFQNNDNENMDGQIAACKEFRTEEDHKRELDEWLRCFQPKARNNR